MLFTFGWGKRACSFNAIGSSRFAGMTPFGKRLFTTPVAVCRAVVGSKTPNSGIRAPAPSRAITPPCVAYVSPPMVGQAADITVQVGVGPIDVVTPAAFTKGAPK